MALLIKPSGNAQLTCRGCSISPRRSPLFLLAAASSSSLNHPSSSLVQLSRPGRGRGKKKKVVTRFVARSESPSSSSGAAVSGMAATRVKAVATIKVTVGGFLSSLRPSRAIDDVKDLIGRSLYLELVSSQLDAKTGQEKPTLRSYAHQVADNDDEVVTYEADFDVPAGYGDVGAVLVTNEHFFTEIFLQDIKLSSDDGSAAAPLTIKCNSWVQPKSGDGDEPGKRVFFVNKLESPESLAHALTTIIWVASAHHAAVNFGQYDFGGYFPNRPSIARTKMPVEEPVDAAAYAAFLDNPDQALRECFPSQVQATLVMAVLDLLSTHSPDEEYLGGPETAPWNNDGEVQAAYGKFNARLKEIEGIIDGRNTDRSVKNRCGAGIVPYQLMKPFSQPGVTGMGIPNSTSI